VIVLSVSPVTSAVQRFVSGALAHCDAATLHPVDVPLSTVRENVARYVWPSVAFTDTSRCYFSNEMKLEIISHDLL